MINVPESCPTGMCRTYSVGRGGPPSDNDEGVRYPPPAHSSPPAVGDGKPACCRCLLGIVACSRRLLTEHLPHLAHPQPPESDQAEKAPEREADQPFTCSESGKYPAADTPSESHDDRAGDGMGTEPRRPSLTRHATIIARSPELAGRCRSQPPTTPTVSAEALSPLVSQHLHAERRWHRNNAHRRHLRQRRRPGLVSRR